MVVSSGHEHLGHHGLAMRQAEAIAGAGSARVMFQLREKGLQASRLLDLASAIRPVLEGCGSLLLVNERSDIALASRADGVHLTEASCPAVSIRRAFPGMLAGQSVHSAGAAVDAAKSGVDYLLFGPVFATPSKEAFGPPQGLHALELACRAVRIPVFAVGGITPERAFACIESGAWGVAAIKPFLDVASLTGTIETFNEFLPA